VTVGRLCRYSRSITEFPAARIPPLLWLVVLWLWLAFFSRQLQFILSEERTTDWVSRENTFAWCCILLRVTVRGLSVKMLNQVYAFGLFSLITDKSNNSPGQKATYELHYIESNESIKFSMNWSDVVIVT